MSEAEVNAGQPSVFDAGVPIFSQSLTNKPMHDGGSGPPNNGGAVTTTEISTRR